MVEGLERAGLLEKFCVEMTRERFQASPPLTSGGELGPKRSFWVRGATRERFRGAGDAGEWGGRGGVGRTRGSRADAGDDP